MKKLLLILFVLISLQAHSQEQAIVSVSGFFQHPQQINIFENMPSQPIDMKCIIGDNWNKSNGFSFAVSFDRYYFYADGTFKYENGYSGGAYSVTTFEGKYKIDENKNIINFNVKKKSYGGHVKMPGKGILYMSIKILGINDTIVAIQAGVETKVYYRTSSCMKDQTSEYAKKYTKEYQNRECYIDENNWKYLIESATT